jgi:hypothetical protein
MRAFPFVSLACSLLALACRPDAATAPIRNVVIPSTAASTVSNSPCTGCVFGVATYTQTSTAATAVTSTFATTPRMTYQLDIDDLDTRGADESVTLNGLVFQAPRQPDEIGPRRKHYTISGLTNPSTIVVTQLGKKKSQVRVAVRQALDVVNVAPAVTTLTIGGAAMDYTATILNYSLTTTITSVFIQNWIEQGTARRAAAASAVFCDPAPFGSVPPGACQMPYFALANNTTSAGTGTLVPGAATLVVQLYQSTVGSDVVYREARVPITLVNP